MRASWSVLFLLWLTAGTCRAALDPSKPLHQFQIKNWQAEQGLPQNSVLAIAQTPDGYLWVGTEEGLARYDGVRFLNFERANSGLKDNVVRALAVDRRGTLWVGTQSGGLFQCRDGLFSPVPIHGGQTTSITSLLVDKSGALWIGSENAGLIQYQAGTEKEFTLPNGPPGAEILSLTQSQAGELWVVTRGGLFHQVGKEFHKVDQAGLASDDIRAIATDADGTIWLGTDKGISRIKDGRTDVFTTRDGLSGNEITSLYVDSAHSLWIGTATAGLNRFAQGKFTNLAENLLSGTDIGTIFEDAQGDLWVGTGGHGLLSIDEGTFSALTTKDGLPSDMILPVLEDSAGSLWIGSQNGLTKRTKTGSRVFTVQDGLPSSFIFSLGEDANHNIWVGTRAGIALLSHDHVRPFPLPQLAPSTVAHSLLGAKNGDVWIGSRDGLSRYNGKTLTTYTGKEGLPGNIVLCLQEDTRGAIWVGTDAGLSVVRDGKIQTYTVAEGLSGNTIQAIYIDRDSVLWLATTKGLNRMNAGHITSFAGVTHLLDGSLSTVLEDKVGNLWVSSNRGIIRVSKEDLTRHANGIRGQAIRTAAFGVADGMRTSECNGGFQPAGWSANDGRLYFPTMAGLAVTDPGRKKVPRGGPVVIERMVINGMEFVPSDTAAAAVGSGKLEIQFTAPDLHYQNKIRFRYMLEGLDRDWVDADSRRTAYYTNMPYGEYQFRAQANVDGAWGAESRPLRLTLTPHFYQTTTFYLFAILAVLTAGGAAYRIRMDQSVARELKLRRLVDQRTSALRQSEAELRHSRDELEARVAERTRELTHVNRSLEEEVETRRQTEQLLILAKESAESANRAKSDFLANMSHELRTPINGILGMTEITLNTELDAEQTEYLEIAKTSADSLLSIVNDILDFSKIEARKLNLEHIDFSARKTIEDVFRSMQLRAAQKNLRYSLEVEEAFPNAVKGDPLRLRQVLLNLLDNAIKFTKEGSISLSATVQAREGDYTTIHLAVKDSGIGIAPEKKQTIFEAFSQADNSSTRRYGGTGLGLTISHQLAVMQGGNLWVESELGQGSTFHFTARLQVIRTAPEPEPAGEYSQSYQV